ncbi:type II secretion system protein E [Anaerocolumna cellulosilytica]|uniref:Type II secretion system protein E n=1 Tax=Anaerocolumna cellulosilytica TaxID=433286 RepID=A0A6S6QV39_9FIRM|nr:CpaF/VirB11 family protein [Anaerocolumna cellulosilytica]MBB5194602.1 pilus assembly protein CpaF [Anaerocolumna cellulosilytica]BCJ93546.1 type II secretion system protein E [Anaerocolumna cellulosilytica]
MKDILASEMSEKGFQEVFSEVQSYISENFSTLITGEVEDTDITKEQLKNHIKKYLTDRKLVVKDMSMQETINHIYIEMTEFSILNQYLDSTRTDIEEININAWNDIKVTFSDGVTKSVEHFFNPQHCENIIRRLLNRESKMVLDKSRPIVRGHLLSKIRITVMGDGVIDSSIGLAASLRIVNPKKLKKQDFINNGTGTEEMITLLETLLQNGISMCITGETSSGKTTFMSYLLTTIPHKKRIFTIEEDVREFDLIAYDEEGKVLNNVVHTRTKKSDDPTKVIDQEKLLETAMTMNPDVICVAEMKGKESFAAQEAANTGHTVITTTHANSCRATYSRMENLCRTRTNMDSHTLKEMLKDAFPIIVFAEKLEDNVRRITEITECVRDSEGNSKIVTLYEYAVNETTKDSKGNIRIKGEFVKRNDISERVQKLLMKKGIRLNDMSFFGVKRKEAV